jgi:hypothetical protein
MKTKRTTLKKARKTSATLSRARVRKVVAEVYANKHVEKNIPKFTEVIVTNKHALAHSH